MAEELNVKEVKFAKGKPSIKLDTKLTDKLRAEGVMRELVRTIQNSRKKAGLNVDDRIKLHLETDNRPIADAYGQFKDQIFAEVLVTGELRGWGIIAKWLK